ncbi:unnamed protein product, partial [Amoebophrya sp. A120]
SIPRPAGRERGSAPASGPPLGSMEGCASASPAWASRWCDQIDRLLNCTRCMRDL